MSNVSIPNNESVGLAAPVSEKPSGGAPTMSTPATLTGIFFEPSAVFESLRERPRFLVATIICIVAFMLFNITYFQKIGFETVIRAQTEASPRSASATTEQKEQAIDIQLKPAVKAIRLLSPILIFAVLFSGGAALYLFGAILMGGKLSYKQALSVWAYSSLPPAVLIMVVNFVLLFVAPPDGAMEIARGSRRGLVHANLGMLVDSAASPVLATTLGAFDIFGFLGLFLAALGLRKVGRMSTGGAWMTVILLWGIGLVLRMVYAAFTQTPM